LSEQITIIYPPIANWHLLYQRPQQLLTAFSRIEGVRSIFVTLERFKKLDKPIMEINDDMFVVREGVNYDHLIRGKKVLWFSYPPLISYADKFKFDLIVFDAIDNPVDEFSHWKQDMDKAVKRADIISCTARVMYEYHKNCGKPVFMCPNGADYHHFQKARSRLQRPGDFPDFEAHEKVIGFYGAMSTWIDIDLIEKIAERYRVVLIGNTSFAKIDVQNKNITVLEHKDYSELPFYLSWFDAALIPFKLTEMTKGCDPIKFYEYLSAGKPVLATRLTELNKFSHVAYFIDRSNCHEVIERALREDNAVRQEQRMKIARENSWDARAEKALEMIKNYICI